MMADSHRYSVTPAAEPQHLTRFDVIMAELNASAAITHAENAATAERALQETSAEFLWAKSVPFIYERNVDRDRCGWLMHDVYDRSTSSINQPYPSRSRLRSYTNGTHQSGTALQSRPRRRQQRELERIRECISGHAVHETIDGPLDGVFTISDAADARARSADAVADSEATGGR
jgi:hypothetical protein